MFPVIEKEHSRRKTFLVFGVALTTISLVFLIQEGLRYKQPIATVVFSENAEYWIFASFLACCISAALSVVAWRHMLAAVGGQITLKNALAISLMSSIAKYIPGNIGHHIGKVGLSMQIGLDFPSISYSIAGELLVTALAAAAIVLLVFVTTPADFSLLSSVIVSLRDIFSATILTFVGIGASLLLFGYFIVGRIGIVQRFSAIPKGTQPGKNSLLALAVQMVNFLILGASFFFISQASDGSLQEHAFVMTGIFTAAWLAGFLTPGSPGGIGIRETILTLGLTPIVGGANALFFSVAHRLVSIAADAFLFVLGIALARLALTRRQ